MTHFELHTFRKLAIRIAILERRLAECDIEINSLQPVRAKNNKIDKWHKIYKELNDIDIMEEFLSMTKSSNLNPNLLRGGIPQKKKA